MHLFLLIVLRFLTLTIAAPTTTISRQSSSTTSEPAVLTSKSAPFVSSHRGPPTHIPQQDHTRSDHSIQILTAPTRTRTRSSAVTSINPYHPHPFIPRPDHRGHPHGQPSITIAFEVLGGFVLIGILASVLRCFYNYKRTPKRDRIADIVQRHNLQRELEELERNPHVLRRPSLREPAPPYFPRPPSYEEPLAPPSPTTASRTEYIVVPVYSPPPSPPAVARTLAPSPPPPRIPDSVPQMPQG